MSNKLINSIINKIQISELTWEVTFELIPETAIVIVRDSNGEVIDPSETNTYQLEAGTYSYTVMAEGYTPLENQELEISNEIVIEETLEQSLETVSFAEGTDEQIEKMLNAHYNGEIDISEYWKVRRYKTSAIRSNGSWNRSR